MDQGIQVVSGHRLRDLVAALSVIALGTAVAMAAVASEPPASLEIPSLLFGGGCAAILLAYLAGYLVDGLAERYPGISRARRCPWFLLCGLPLAAACFAATQVDAALVVDQARDVVSQVRAVLPVE